MPIFPSEEEFPKLVLDIDRALALHFSHIDPLALANALANVLGRKIFEGGQAAPDEFPAANWACAVTAGVLVQLYCQLQDTSTEGLQAPPEFFEAAQSEIRRYFLTALAPEPTNDQAH